MAVLDNFPPMIIAKVYPKKVLDLWLKMSLRESEMSLNL